MVATTNKSLSVVLLMCVCILAGAAQAAQPRMLQTYDAWSAYTFMDENGSKVCYMASAPKKAEGNYKDRDDVHALVTNRPSEHSKDVFSYVAGYKYKPGSNATLQIDHEKFTLFTKDDTAWAMKPETDEKIAHALRTGKAMVVTGMSAKGTATTDTYSLEGTSNAYDRMSKECAH